MKENIILNAFTVDVEGFIESNIESFNIPDRYLNEHDSNFEIEKNTNIILDLLSEAGVFATFFFVGRIAKDIPHLIKKVADNGHEIGCHNYEHIRVFNLVPEQFKINITIAKKKLEDVSGKSVTGFRAPDFSITKKSLWALDILKEIGFIYDSSIYPISIHDVYGVDNCLPYIHKFKNGLIEVPMSTFNLFGRKIQFGGGGYFRLYPLWFTKKLLLSANTQNNPCIFYIHPYEVGPIIPKINEISFSRKFRHYYNCSKGANRIKKLLGFAKFGSVQEIIKSLNI